MSDFGARSVIRSSPPRWLDVFKGQSARIARDVSCMTGKPLKQAAGEVNTVLDRARTMVALAPAALAATAIAEPAGSALKRKITREPIGVVAVLCPWNYPLICAVRAPRFVRERFLSKEWRGRYIETILSVWRTFHARILVLLCTPGQLGDPRRHCRQLGADQALGPLAAVLGPLCAHDGRGQRSRRARSGSVHHAILMFLFLSGLAGGTVCPTRCASDAVLTKSYFSSRSLLIHRPRSTRVLSAAAHSFSPGRPATRVQSVYADHAQVAQLVQHADVGYVSFTGSVAGGRAVYRAAAASRAHTFIDVGLGTQRSEHKAP
jgi:hypothetical protein